MKGRKPIAFAAWLFALLGAQPSDVLDDLYPGTGIIGRAWEELMCRSSPAHASSSSSDVSPGSSERVGRPTATDADDVGRVELTREPSPVDGRRVGQTR